MTDATPETDKKKKKGSFFKRRLLLYGTKALILLFCACDWYFETKGLPPRLHDYVERRLRHDSFRFTAEKIHVGLINGIVFSNPKLVDRVLSPKPIFTASKLQFTLYSSLIPLSTAIIEDGEIKAPLFPEMGEEGDYDILHVKNLNAMLEADGQDLIVNYASWRIENIIFKGKGVFDSVLPNIMDRVGRKPAKNKPMDTQSKTYFTLSDLIKNTPIDERRTGYLFMKRFNKDNFPSPLSCSVDLVRFDPKDYKNSNIIVNGKAQRFTFGSMPVTNAQAKVNIQNSSLNVESFDIEFEGKHKIHAAGEFSLPKQKGSVKIKGTLTPQIIKRLTGKQTFPWEKHNVDLKSEILSFNATLDEFSASTRKYSAKIDAEYPMATIKGNKLTNIKASLKLNDRHIACSSLTANLIEGGDLRTSFDYKPGRLSADLAGSVKFKLLNKILEGTSVLKQLKEYKIASKKEIAFKTSLLTDPANKLFEAKADVSIPKLSINSHSFSDISASLSYDGDVIKSKNLRLTLNNGTQLRANTTYSPTDNTAVSSLTSKGNPLPILDILSEKQRDQIMEKMKLITWPKKSNLVDLTVDLYLDWSKEFFCSLYGDLTINDFAVKGYPFTYGATTGFAHFNKKEVNATLPVIMLERPEGQALMAISFKEVKKDDYDPNNVNNRTSFKEKSLLFKVDSSMTGNVLLDMFVKHWNPEVVNFPESSAARVEGVINFTTKYGDYADIEVLDSTFLWNGIQLDHVSANCNYNDGHLSFDNATAKFHGGDVKVAHDSWFGADKSKTVASIKNANFTDLLQHYDFPIAKGNKPGRLDLNLNVNSISTDDKPTEYYGTGNVKVSDADLWGVPVLRSLQSLIDSSWSFNQFGRVSSLDSTFTLEKDHVHANSIETDGSIIALSGEGDYYWTDKNYEFKVQAKVLKNALPFKLMSYALSPLTWFLEARLIGKDSNYEWGSTRIHNKLFKSLSK